MVDEGAKYRERKRKGTLTFLKSENFLTVTHAAPNPVIFYVAISNFLVLRVRAE